MTNLDSVLKSRNISAYKVPFSQSYGFSSSHVWMWELDHKEGWAPKDWHFWTLVLEKTLRVPWTAGSSNQSILKEINPEYSLEVLMLKLKLQYFGYLMHSVDSLEKTLKVVTFLPRSKHLLISWLQSPSAVILEPKKIKSLSFHCFPICHKVMVPDEWS